MQLAKDDMMAELSLLRNNMIWNVEFQAGNIFYLIRDMVVERCNTQFGCETIHPTQKFISMSLLQMPCVIKWI